MHVIPDPELFTDKRITLLLSLQTLLESQHAGVWVPAVMFPLMGDLVDGWVEAHRGENEMVRTTNDVLPGRQKDSGVLKSEEGVVTYLIIIPYS